VWDIYAVRSDGGEPRNLTNTPAISEQNPRWSHDGCTIAFSFRPKDGRQTDIALLECNTHAVRRLTNEQQAGYSWNVLAWRPDDNG